jgi:hypothetical protein
LGSKWNGFGLEVTSEAFDQGENLFDSVRIAFVANLLKLHASDELGEQMAMLLIENRSSRITNVAI